MPWLNIKFTLYALVWSTLKGLKVKGRIITEPSFFDRLCPELAEGLRMTILTMMRNAS
jgi:hypothetical protein